MKLHIFIVALVCAIFSGTSQNISGLVLSSQQEPLIGANVYWLNSQIGTTTNSTGAFTIPKNKSKHLIASFIGFKSDTIQVNNESEIKFQLTEKAVLDEVELAVKKEGIAISNIKNVKTENISKVELAKFACCDLAGGFATQLTVQSKTTNVITNSKELQILGLAGVYNQVLLDGFPMIRGLSQTYGISSIPGNLVQNIHVAKGANSVLQGFESISGQINVMLKKPQQADKLLANFYINNFGEKHLNTDFSINKGEWSNLLAFSTVQPANKIDGDNDNFLDLPLLERYMLQNTLQMGKRVDWGWSSTTTARFVKENRLGGQTHYSKESDLGSSTVYGQNVDYIQPEIFSKWIYRFNDDQDLMFYGSGQFHDQNSYFGTTKYDAKQSYLYGKAQFSTNYTKAANIKIGLSYRHLNLKENISFTNPTVVRSFNGEYNTKESITGLFMQHKSSHLNNLLTITPSLRVDHHNTHGFIASPRLLIKYDLNENTTIRSNFGYGWRTAQVFSENIGIFVNSRDIILQENLNPEKARNFGVNYTQKYSKGDFDGLISMDYYHTSFQNQIFPDYDEDPRKIVISNFTDKSISSGFQTEVSTVYKSNFELKVGYNYLDVYREVNGEKRDLQFNIKHRFSLSMSYQFLDKKLHTDINMHFNGRSRLPNTSANPTAYQRPNYSKPFTTVNAQVSYYLKKVKLYTGCENILGFRQNRAILSWEDPFSPYFDTSSVWGPTRGREIYFGITYKLN